MRILLLVLAVAWTVALAYTDSPAADSPTTYGVTIHFQIPFEQVEPYLRDYDPGLEFLYEDSLPPTGYTALTTDEKDFCARVEAELQSRNYVRDIDCREIGDATQSNSPSQDGPATQYGLTIHFQIPPEQPGVDAVEAYLRDFDPELEFLLDVSLPPAGHVMLSTSRKDFCATVEAELESRSYIWNIDCREIGDATPSKSPNAG